MHSWNESHPSLEVSDSPTACMRHLKSDGAARSSLEVRNITWREIFLVTRDDQHDHLGFLLRPRAFLRVRIGSRVLLQGSLFFCLVCPVCPVCARFAQVFPGTDRAEPRAPGVARRRPLPRPGSLARPGVLPGPGTCARDSARPVRRSPGRSPGPGMPGVARLARGPG